ncbi:hypothetical protein ABTE92_19630, partial [Acinetobacter baumannii]
KQAGKPATLIELSRKPDHIAAVSRYLTDERRIPAELVKALSDNGFILALQAGRFTNAAFPLTQGSFFGQPANAVGVLL